jgi:hypothetical protein
MPPRSKARRGHRADATSPIRAYPGGRWRSPVGCARPARALLITDVPRCALIAGGATVATTVGLAAGLLVALVLVPALAVRHVGVPGWLDVSLTSVLGVHALGSGLGLFDAVPWEDNVVHAVVSLLCGPVIYVGILRLGSPADERRGIRRPPAAGAVLLVFTSTLGLGAAWELVEWAFDLALHTNFSLGYIDTLTDLLADACGALAGSIWVATGRWGRIP